MSDDVTWSDVAWSGEQLARIYQPGPAVEPRRAAVLDVHGGAWNSQDRTLGERYDRALAAAGYLVVAIDFRDGRTDRHPAAALDIAAAVAWLRNDAERWRIDPDRVALMGSSSGGHLALYSALTLVEVAFVAAFWPPVDPLARYRYARDAIGRPVPEGQAFDAARLVASSEAYFGDEATMAEASIATVVATGRARHRPPVWLVRAGDDLNVPPSMLEELASTYRQAGGEVELTDYPDQHHGFGHRSHDVAVRFRADLVQRLVAVLP